jgi:NAD(P)-dependent dehydrogenase (short-subunit alcohol dehydrogenase family)
MMSRRLEDRVAIITGASSGIGKTTALQFAREGAKVVVAARREQESLEVVSEITSNGGSAIYVQTDVGKWDQVENMVSAALSKYGRLDCAFNNAGLSGRLTEGWLTISEEQWDQTADVNLKGVWMCMRHQIPAMLESGGGVIVNNSSLLGMRGAGSAPYAATKHGVIGLTRSAAVTFGDQNIRVNSVAPGFIVTPIMEARFKENPDLADKFDAVIPMGELGGPETIAEAVTWLCSDESAYITGQTLTVDGGVLAQMLPKMT